MSGPRGKFFQGDLNTISAVSVSFNDNLLLCNHRIKSLNSWLITNSAVSSFLPGNKRLMSSAKWRASDFEDHLY